MRSALLSLSVWLISCPAGLAWAADAGQSAAEPNQPAPPASAGAAEQAKPQDAEYLPAPLDKIACNLSKLKASGHVDLSSAVLGHAEDFGDESLVWTVKVLKPISCRHALILLRSFSDVRFYHSEEDTVKELYSTNLVYSTRLAEGAVNGEVLQQDEEFQVWVVISLRHLDVLTRQQADAVVFGKPQVVRVRPLSESDTRWTTAGTGIPRWFSKRQEPFRLPK
jgi:hypothetical protein